MQLLQRQQSRTDLRQKYNSSSTSSFFFIIIPPSLLHPSVLFPPGTKTKKTCFFFIFFFLFFCFYFHTFIIIITIFISCGKQDGKIAPVPNAYMPLLLLEEEKEKEQDGAKGRREGRVWRLKTKNMKKNSVKTCHKVRKRRQKDQKRQKMYNSKIKTGKSGISEQHRRDSFELL